MLRLVIIKTYMEKVRNQNKVIGFDLDGVIIDHTQNKLRVAKDLGVLLGILETPSDILKGKVKSDIEKRIEKTIYDEPSVALTPPLFPGAMDAIKQVSQSWPCFLISRRTFNYCPSVLEKLVDVRHRILHDPLNVYPDSNHYKKVLSWQEFLISLNLI